MTIKERLKTSHRGKSCYPTDMIIQKAKREDGEQFLHDSPTNGLLGDGKLQ